MAGNKYKNETWVLTTKRADFDAIAERFGIDPVVARLLVNRDVCSDEDIAMYLSGSERDLYDPTLLKDLTKAADIIDETISSGGLTVISSDYDVDGIFSGQILYEMITMLGGRARIMTPHRVHDGYGLNERIVREAASEGAALILTCDNGVSASKPIKLAKSLGMKVVITDHHEIPYEEVDGERRYILPEADAIVDHKQEDDNYPFKGLCGAGVALKLASYMFGVKGIDIPDTFFEYAAIATISDVMVLSSENRVIVKKGLSTLGNTKNVGLRAMLDVCEIDKSNIGAYHIGFIIGPCFNAAGRLESTEAAQQMLTTSDRLRAHDIAVHLKKLNDSRKEMTEKGFTRAVDIIEESGLYNDKIIMVALDDLHESIAGIIAGRLRERYSKPVFVFAKTYECYKGSGRSIDTYHMHEGLTEQADFIRVFGGHALAAGLSVDFDKLDMLRANLNSVCNLTEEDFTQKIKIDIAMPISYISEELIEAIEGLEPFGYGNPKPLFAENSFAIRSARVIGKTKNMLKLKVMNKAGYIVDAIMFNNADAFIEEACERYGEDAWNKALTGHDNPIDAAFTYYPVINEYMGTRTVQIQIQNYRFN